MIKKARIQIQGDPSLPTVINLPGLHGHWAFMARLRQELKGKVRWVDIAYPALKARDMLSYGQVVTRALHEEGIKEGWLLAESFGSQVAWELMKSGKEELEIKGIILAGGFTRHPLPWGARMLKGLMKRFPKGTATVMAATGAFLCRRNGLNEEMREDLKKFPFDHRDLIAMGNRLALIADNDPRETVARVRVPVYLITGFWDALVPYPLVWCGLRKNCPGFTGAKVVFSADHAVAVSNPHATAEFISRCLGFGL